MATTVTCSKCGCPYASDERHVCPNGEASVEAHPEIVTVQSAEDAMSLWPTLDSAFGCVNCKAIFRALDTKALVTDSEGRCPRCGSESCFDVAAAINKPSVSVERLRPIVDALDGALESALGLDMGGRLV